MKITFWNQKSSAKCRHVAKLKEAIQVLKTKKQSDSEKNSDAMGYKHLFKQPDEEKHPKEKH